MSKRRSGGEEGEAGAQAGRDACGPATLAVHGPPDGDDEPLHPIFEGGREAELLTLEALVEGGAGDTCQFDDVGDLRVLVAVVNEGSGETIEDPASLVGDHLGAREPRTRRNSIYLRRR